MIDKRFESCCFKRYGRIESFVSATMEIAYSERYSKLIICSMFCEIFSILSLINVG